MTSKEQFAANLNSRIKEINFRNAVRNQLAESRKVLASLELAKYDQDVESNIEAARTAYEDIILPWLAEFSAPITIAFSGYSVQVSGPIISVFPESALRLQYSGDGDVIVDEKWRHVFYLNQNHLEVRRSPESGIKGSAHAMVIHHRYLVISTGDFGSLCGPLLVHPKVIIEFADLIESGKIYDLIGG